MTVTTKQIGDALRVAQLVVECVKECGPQGCPSGVLYASLMGHGTSLEGYQSLIRMIKSTGLVRESGHVLYYVEPRL